MIIVVDSNPHNYRNILSQKVRYNTSKPEAHRMASQIDITKDIQPLTTFRNNSVKMMQRLKKTRRPIILTVNGKPEAVVQDAAAYQRLLDLAAAADVNEGIRQGLEELRQGKGRPAKEFFEEMRKKHALSR